MLNARLIGVLPVLLILVSMAAAEPTARLDTYTQSDGVTFFAVSLAAGQELPVIDRHDVVVLFDTSASQTSIYRDSAIAALDGLLAGLSPSDRVKLIAVDLTASVLNDSFVAPKGDAIQAARTKLLARPPLGSTDMETALQTAAHAWDEASDTARAVVYIGDGVSMINLLNGQKLQALIEDLIAARAPISSLAIGPRTDTQLLAVLANQTGGNLYVAEPLVFADPDQGVLPERAEAENIRRSRLAGARLAAWTQAAVAWPIDSQLPKVFKEVYPAKVLPLRSDRSTILIGQLDGPVTEPLPMNVLVTSGSEQIQLSFTATGQPSNPDQAFLASLVEGARADAGLTLPTVGDEGLAEVRRLVRSNLDQLTMLAEQAATTGNTQGAQRIAQAVLHHDPGNLRAETVHLLAARAPEAGKDTSPTDLRLVAQAESTADEPAAESPANSDFEAQPGSFLDSHVEHSAIVAELIRKEVELALDDARKTMSDNPDQVIQDLKLARENIRRAPELDMETQTVLISRLESAIKEAGQRQADRDERLREQLERQRAARAQRDMNDRFLRTIQKQKQRMESFESLMDENRYKEAVDMAGLVEEVDPNGVVPRVATLWARLAGNERDMQIIRAERHRAFFDALYQSERSSVPFPDEPPIVYPPADVWEELTYRRKKYRAVDLKSQGGAEEKIMAALEEQIGEPIEFIETPLSDAINLIKDDYKIEIQLDKPALEDLAISTDTPVTASYQGISLRSALRLMLGELELTYVIKDEVLLITTQEKASEELTVKVYPVADLVLPIQNTSMMGGFGGLGGGMGGGMMGGMGGMGGGMMGGMGGMGGGMMGGMGGMGGGMGGMGMGGGMFNVTDESVAHPVDANHPTAVPGSELPNLTPTKTANPTDSNVADLPTKSKSSGISINLEADPETVWNGFFQGRQTDPADVRQLVRELMRSGQTKHAIALIQAALCHGQPQAWMYEALGIAMDIDGRSREEIERAVMSSVEFVTSPAELLYIAGYLSRTGFDQRALQLAHQAVQIQPLAYEAYLLGLESAQRLNDVDGIRWATVGLLSQEWTKEQSDVQNRAFRAARALLDQLQKEGRKKEFTEYEQQLDEAMIRDCVVVVRWTGDADVDLIVAEPGDTLCSLHTPRTTSGGINLGDTYAQFNRQNEDGFSETYICPKGFPGQYRVRVRRVWGEVTAGKVTVDVYIHYRTKQQKHERQQINLGKDDALVIFNLDHGRRTESLEQQQVASAVQQHVGLNRAILAQQINAVADPNVIPQRDLPIGSTGPRPVIGRGPDGRPFAIGNSAVGYQPVIITLPEGTNFWATGVVSADRRYVRITSVPFFSGIGEVTTFTYSGSAEETDNDDGGGDDGGDDGGGDDGG